MNPATPTAAAFKEILDAKLLAPVQRNLFTGEPEAVEIEIDRAIPEDETQLDDGISLVKTDDSAQLILSGFGLFLGKKSERLIVRKGKDVIYQFPFFRIPEVVVASKGISISSDLLEELCVRGIRVNFWGMSGKPYALITSPHLNATIQTRRDQLAAFDDQRGLQFSRAVVEGKIRNQEKLLRYFAKYIKRTDEERFAKINAVAGSLRTQWKKVRGIEGQTVDDCRQTLMGIEGVSGRIYWEAAGEIIRGKTEFLGREHRGATDVVNAMLNYGYGILYGNVWGAILNAGLEPFAGFLHVDRPGKASLVLDLVEEFRQPVVDRAVLSAVNLGMSVRMENGLLDRESRERISARVLERLVSQETASGKRLSDPFDYSDSSAAAGVISARRRAVSSVSVQMVTKELRTLVMYDIQDDRIRYRISEACLDFGLERIQFSVFRGKLNRNKREELLQRLTDELGEQLGKILIQPVCEEDWVAALELATT